MGGRVAVEMGLRHPERVDRLVLLGPSPAFLKNRDHVRLVGILRPELALVPLALPHAYVRREIRRMFASPSRLDDAWYDAAADGFLRVFRTIRGRISFFWGAGDRLVPAAFAQHVEASLPTATSIVLEDCGHVPQYEPDTTSELVRRFLEEPNRVDR